jgi:NAD(P)H-nitrite reductase large subunit
MDIKNCPISIVYFVYVQHAACISLKIKQIEFYLVLDTILRFKYSVSTLHSSLEDTMTKEQEIIARLLEWAEYMGGFDSQVWRDAEELMSQESVLENEQ